MFKHRAARLVGLSSPCRPGLQTLYDDLVVLSGEEKSRLEHYRRWLTAKELSMTAMDEAPSTVYRLERSPKDWIKAADLRLKGRDDEAKTIVKQSMVAILISQNMIRIGDFVTIRKFELPGNSGQSWFRSRAPIGS